MDKNERENFNARGGKKTGSSSFGGGFSINKFLNSLGAVPEMTERQQNYVPNMQRGDDGEAYKDAAYEEKEVAANAESEYQTADEGNDFAYDNAYDAADESDVYASRADDRNTYANRADDREAYASDVNAGVENEVNTTREESDAEFDAREKVVINKFSGVRWTRKHKNAVLSEEVAARNSADYAQNRANYAQEEIRRNELNDAQPLVAQEEGFNPEVAAPLTSQNETQPEATRVDANVQAESVQPYADVQAEFVQPEPAAQTEATQNETAALTEVTQNETAAQTEVTRDDMSAQTDTAMAAGAQDDDFDDFDAFLKSLESEEAAVEARQNSQPNSSAAGAANGVATAAGDAGNIVTGSAGNAVSGSQNVSENAGLTAANADGNANEITADGETGKAEATGTQNTDAAGTDGGKRRKSISKLDYFKYRFLDNSATGANGKANLERMTSRFGTRRQETASTITSAHGEVNVSAKDDLYGKEINLDFSKKGNAKVYHNTQTLAFVACIAAFIYAIAGVVVFMMFGIVTPPKVEVVSAKLNVGGIIYAQKGETLDLSNVKIFVNYNNGQKKTVAFDKSLIVEKDAAMVDDDLKVVGLSQTVPTVIKVAYDNKVGEILVWGYEWTANDVILSYFLTKEETVLSDYSNVCCIAKFSKTVGAGTSYAKTITKTSTIVDFENDVTSASLSGSTIRFEGNVGGFGGSWTAEKVK